MCARARPDAVAALYIGSCTHFASARYTLSQEYHHLRRVVQEQITIAKQHGFSDWLATGQIYRGWILMQTDPAQGLQQVQQGVADINKVGTRFSVWWFLLGAAYLKSGQIEKGLQTVNDALAITEKAGHHIFDSLLFNLKGELLRVRIGTLPATSEAAESTVKDVEECYRQALAVAGEQQAKTFELRIAVSLAQWWRSRSRQAEARDLLEPIYAWFSEGFDSVDLQHAQTLLRQLGDR